MVYVYFVLFSVNSWIVLNGSQESPRDSHSNETPIIPQANESKMVHHHGMPVR